MKFVFMPVVWLKYKIAVRGEVCRRCMQFVLAVMKIQLIFFDNEESLVP